MGAVTKYPHSKNITATHDVYTTNSLEKSGVKKWNR